MKGWLKILIISFIAAAIVIEFSISFLLSNSDLAGSGRLLQFLQFMHCWSEQNVIQLNSQCARYDPDLTYTLKPGVFTFSDREFSVVFKVNNAGLRGSEDALRKPEIIVIGDSMAMGWGVDQDKIYSSIIEQKTGLKVLNAAVSSYGTAREILLLNKLDTSNLKYLMPRRGRYL